MIYIIKTLAFGKRQTTLFIYYFLGRHAVEIIAMLLAIVLVLR